MRPRPDPVQPELPLDPPGRSRELRTADGQFRLRVAFEPGGGRVELHETGRLITNDGQLALDWSLRVRVRPPVSLHMSFTEGPELVLASADRTVGDVLDALGDLAYERLEDATLPPSERDRLVMASADILDAFRSHLVREAVPTAIDTARRFNPAPGMFWFVYARAAGDSTGRVGQVIDTCPGLLGFVRRLEALGHDAAVAALLAKVVEGQRLPRILDQAVDLWRTHAAPAEADPDLGRRMRLWIRRAGPGVSPTLLWNGPPPILVPEDIPGDAEENAEWYAIQSRVTTALRSAPDGVTERQRRALHRFFSRRALEIEARDGLLADRWLGEQVSTLARFCASTGRCIDAGTNLDRLEDALYVAEYDGLDRQLAGVLRIAGDLPFPASKLAERLPWEDGDFAIHLLEGAAAVRNEACRMRHCVYLNIPDALEGRCHLLHATVAGRPLTLRLEHAGDGKTHVLAEVAGRRNRQPTGYEAEAVHRWLRSLGEA